MFNTNTEHNVICSMISLATLVAFIATLVA